MINYLKKIYRRTIGKEIRWEKFNRKLISELPKYHSKTREKCKWEIRIFWKNQEFDSKTGKRIKGYPSVWINDFKSQLGWKPWKNRKNYYKTIQEQNQDLNDLLEKAKKSIGSNDDQRIERITKSQFISANENY